MDNITSWTARLPINAFLDAENIQIIAYAY